MKNKEKMKKQKKNLFIFALISALVILICVLCLKNTQTYFAVSKIDYETTLQKARAYEEISNAYSNSYGGGLPGPFKLCGRIIRKSERAWKKSRRYYAKAEREFVTLCKEASDNEDFKWLYQRRTSAPKKQVVDAIFDNEYFVPDSSWVEFRKVVLGREFYTK